VYIVRTGTGSIEAKKRSRDGMSRSSEVGVAEVKTDFRPYEVSRTCRFTVSSIFHARQFSDECVEVSSRACHRYCGSLVLSCLDGLVVEI
jgi:hypothetical protein